MLEILKLKYIHNQLCWFHQTTNLNATYAICEPNGLWIKTMTKAVEWNGNNKDDDETMGAAVFSSAVIENLV